MHSKCSVQNCDHVSKTFSNPNGLLVLCDTHLSYYSTNNLLNVDFIAICNKCEKDIVLMYHSTGYFDSRLCIGCQTHTDAPIKKNSDFDIIYKTAVKVREIYIKEKLKFDLGDFIKLIGNKTVLSKKSIETVCIEFVQEIQYCNDNTPNSKLTKTQKLKKEAESASVQIGIDRFVAFLTTVLPKTEANNDIYQENVKNFLHSPIGKSLLLSFLHTISENVPCDTNTETDNILNQVSDETLKQIFYNIGDKTLTTISKQFNDFLNKSLRDVSVQQMKPLNKKGSHVVLQSKEVYQEVPQEIKSF